MPKQKTDFQKVVGRLISAIQKEWGDELGNSNAEFSEKVMDSAHDLLQAGSADKAKQIIGSMTIRQYLGDVWVQSHPNVKPAISDLESLLNHAG